jgi:hypothetical protein
VQLVEAGKVFRTGTSPSLAALVCLLPYAVFVALLFCLDVLLPSSSSYADQLQDMGVGTALRNVWLYGIMPVEFFTRSMGPVTAVLGKLLYLVSVPAVCLGMVRTWREHYLYAAFTGLFMALLILWPGIQGLRYIFPVMPFYLFFLFHGLNEAAAYLATHIHARPSLPVPAAAYGAVCAALFGLTVSGQAFHALANPGEVMEGPYAPDSAALFHFISEHTRPRDVVIFGKPRALWLYTGRKAIRLTRLEDIMVSRAKYVACRKNDPVDAVLKGRAWVARRVYSNTSFNLYARMRLTPVSLPAEGGEPAGPGNGTAGNREASKKKAQEKGGRRWDGPVRTIIL